MTLEAVVLLLVLALVLPELVLEDGVVLHADPEVHAADVLADLLDGRLDAHQRRVVRHVVLLGLVLRVSQGFGEVLLCSGVSGKSGCIGRSVLLLRGSVGCIFGRYV